MIELIAWTRIPVGQKDNTDRAYDWCTAKFGDTDTPSAVWTYDWGYSESNSDLFYFKNEADAMLFALRWRS